MSDRKLGRKKPLEYVDHGRFKKVVTSSGTHYFPRMGEHYDSKKDVDVPPTGPLGRSAKAMASISQMDMNDSLGDCVIASRNHKVGILTANESGTPVLSTNAEVVADYHAACGAGDNGCDMSAVNQYEQTTGMSLSGVRHPIDGAVTVDNTNKLLCQVCLDVFGTLNVGINLPNQWYQSAEGSDWGPVSGADAEIVGGHEIQGFDYDNEGVWIATWGGTRRILWSAFTVTTWVDELYTSLSKDWYNQGNVAPNGINVATLKADLAAVIGGQVPPLDPSPVVPPVPPVTPPTPVVPPVPPVVPPVPVVPPTPVPTDVSGAVTFNSLELTGPFGVFGRTETITVAGSGSVIFVPTVSHFSHFTKKETAMNLVSNLTKVLLLEDLKAAVLDTGRLTLVGWNSVVSSNTSNLDGTVNWSGVLVILQGLIADLPQILAFITAILPLFGG